MMFIHREGRNTVQ